MNIIKKINNSNNFILILFIFYTLNFFSFNKIIYISTYFLFVVLHYVFSKNIIKSLVYALVLSLFSEIGFASSLFLHNTAQYPLGSSYWLSPTTIFIAILLPLSVGLRINKIFLADVFVILYFAINSLSIIIFPYQNVLFSLFSVTEIVLTYYLLRLNVTSVDLEKIRILIISMVIFQLILGIIQLVLGHPIGLTIESLGFNNSYGYTTIEEKDLFRISGTFSHPNFFASFLLLSIPFIIFSSAKNLLNFLVGLASFFMLFFTFSRIGWSIGIIYLILFLSKYLLLWFIKNKKNIIKLIVISILPISIVMITVMPLFILRVGNISNVFSDFGSFGVRLKLYEEAIHLINQYPITGVGLNRSLEIYSTNPSTNIFTNIIPTSFYSIHDVLLEIGSELGIPGVLIFILFLGSVVFEYFRTDKSNIKKSALLGLIGLIGITLLNPTLHTTQFRYFFLLSALILT